MMSELKKLVQEFRNMVLGKQDKLTPGNNITIDENNVISAKGGSGGGGSGEEHYIKSTSADFTVNNEGKLTLNKATSVEQDNTKPITAAAVYTEVGNINALLETI